MKQSKVWAGFVILVASLMMTSLQARSLPEFTELVSENSPAVINISTKKTNKSRLGQLAPDMELPEGIPFDEMFKHFFGPGFRGQTPRQNESSSLGSGFVLSSDGYILTNHHVIKDADEIIVRFNDRTELEAKVLGSDERSDIALIKVEATGLTAVKLGDSNELKVGEWVLAIGSPFGFDSSATAGIVSALGRNLPSDNYVPFIQTDVAINPGNSGGPLFNMDGEVIGINSQIYSRTGGFMGVSFAIPMDVALDVVEQIKEQGYVDRGWLGVVIQNVTRELAESFGLDKPQGALVSRVMPDSPASKAGIQTGDVIIKFNGKDITTSSTLPPLVGRTKIGNSVPVVVMRNKKQKTLSVVIEKLEEDASVVKTKGESSRRVDDRLAIEVTELTKAQRDKYDVEQGGVIINTIEDGPAAKAGMRRGDVILSLNNVQITGTKQFLDLARELPEDEAIPVLVHRQGGSIFLALKITDKD